MTVQKLILFCSTTSPACVPCLQFLYENKLPVQIVRLDTQMSRNRALQGKYFQISSVPTLVVMHDDGNLQLFAGQAKVLSWLQAMISSGVSSRTPPNGTSKKDVREPVYDISEDIEETSLMKKPHKRKKSRRKKKRYASIEDDEVEIEFVNQDRAPPPPTKGLMVGALAPKKSTGTSIYDIAKQMETQRKATLGYKEKDLPVNNF